MKQTNATPAGEKEKSGNGEREQIPFSPLPLCPLSLALLAALVLAAPATRATISEPDNVLYGNITLSNVLVTAARTDVVIEARRQTNGPAIARYRMGSNPALGNLYALRLQLESVTPIADTNSSQIGDNLVVVVTDGTGLRAQATYTVTDRGVAQRVDFGVAVVDGDGDGLPDAWELFRYANLNQGPASISANGQTAWQNFIAGTDPNDPNGFRLRIALSNNLKQVSFIALRAEGPGYDGLTRLYSLESSPGVSSASWTDVSSFTDLTGNNQTVTYQTTGSGAPGFFRGRISLQGLGMAAADSDADSLPDGWELLHFGNLDQSAASVSANGQTARQNFVAGTNPNDANSLFKLNFTLSGSTRLVSFFAASAQGAGYEGKQRYYSLESSTSPAGPWASVATASNILGNDQILTYQPPSTTTPAFYRGRVWLQP